MKQTKWYPEKAEAAVRRGAHDGLKQWADDVLADSTERVPVAPGAWGGFLCDSGEVSLDEGQMLAAVSYDSPPARGGAPAKPGMAIGVHEKLNVKHANGEAKFLETALQVSAPAGLAELAAALRRSFR